MGNRYGIIDLGSNTFHLLIIDMTKDGFETIYKLRKFVGLAEKGIECLTDDAIERGIVALREFKDQLLSHEVQNFKAIGTAALRSASNGQSFIDQVKKGLEIDIEVIDGQKEAQLIYEGVKLLTPMDKGNYLIMDVGGGSVEFIHIYNGQVKWAQSFNVGVGVLFNAFHSSNPISLEDQKAIKKFLQDQLVDLGLYCAQFDCDQLIGASGSFEVVQSMNEIPQKENSISEVSLADYYQISKKIINSTYNERLAMKGLPESRVKLIVVAMILIDIAIEMIKPKEIMISPFALKEGLISQLKK